MNQQNQRGTEKPQTI